ncbi:MAG TPA: rhodanese-like domain-containing protein [Saprospiraceae bacterium]|nr:rhodanese-like domain-containing protein [Saprospiraceae bacterium]
MNIINAQQLKQRLDTREPFLLINAMEENKFRAKHIPGSLNICRKEDIEKMLKKDDDIVVYCTDLACKKSVLLYQLLELMGYAHICRFAGGMKEWEEAGYLLVGEMLS